MRASERLSDAPHGGAVPAWWRWALLVACGFLLLVRLGHYPLWDDEACTALLAKGVLATGDSAAVQGLNVMAYSRGRELTGGESLATIRDRFQAPLQLYLMAPSLGLLGSNSWGARLPFALVGIGEVALLIHIVRKLGLSRRQWIIFAALLVTNVPLFLYLRQARYYAPSIFAVTWAAWLYCGLEGRPGARRALKLGCVMSLFPLISAQFAATFVPLFVLDYLLFGRKRVTFSAASWGALIGPSVLTAAAILWRWNPLGLDSYPPFELADRATMVWRAFRDVNAAHVGVGALLLAAPMVAWARRDAGLARACVAVAAACVLDGLLDPQRPSTTDFAEIRHLCPLIPVAMYVSAAVIDAAWTWRAALGALLLPLASLTNVLHWGALQPDVRIRSIQYLWARELIAPPLDPYTVTMGWLDSAVPPGATVGVDPEYMRYPLMFHCPRAVYTWQVSPEYRSRLPALEARQFVGEEAPEYFLVFGLREDLEFWAAQRKAGKDYQLVKRSPLYWRDMYRPEVTRRRFGGGNEELTNPNTQGIFLYRR